MSIVFGAPVVLGVEAGPSTREACAEPIGPSLGV